MNIKMERRMTLMSLLLSGFYFSSSAQYFLREYHYINQAMSWSKAQQYCREKYTDLATAESMNDLSRMTAGVSYSWAWIGLWDDPQEWQTAMGNASNSWRWSATGETSETGYSSWRTGEPNFLYRQETCGLMISGGQWLDVTCTLNVPFVCYNVTEQSEKIYVYVNITTTWSSAQSYCREHYKDLATIETDAENTEVSQKLPSPSVCWIGLYRVPWVWSDKSLSTFRNWLKPQNNGINRHCVLMNTLHQWSNEDCDYGMVFFCEQVIKMTTTVKMTTVTDADLTDPEINAQLLSQLGTLLSSRGWTDFKLQWKILPSKKKK